MAKSRPVIPFKPTAGAEPPMLIGREAVIEDFEDGLEEGVGAPARLMRITGPRGSGKTVLLTELGDIARDYGWNVIDVTAQGKLVEDIQHGLASAWKMGEMSVEAELGPLSARFGGVGSQPLTLRDMLTRVTGKLSAKGRGLLVTVDEIQDANPDEVREVATSVQHIIRERGSIAFVFAGLTAGVLDLINGRALTFLRRAKSEELAPLPTDEVARSMRITIENAGMGVDAEALDFMASQTEGYAYLIQLIGYCVFAVARKHADANPTITAKDARLGMERAMAEFASAVQETAIADVSERGAEFLIAMAGFDTQNVSTSDIARAMNLEPQQLTYTRRQLIKAQVIEAPSRGVVRFAIPHMRKFLLGHGEDILARY